MQLSVFSINRSMLVSNLHNVPLIEGWKCRSTWSGRAKITLPPWHSFSAIIRTTSTSCWTIWRPICTTRTYWNSAIRYPNFSAALWAILKESTAVVAYSPRCSFPDLIIQSYCFLTHWNIVREAELNFCCEGGWISGNSLVELCWFYFFKLSLRQNPVLRAMGSKWPEPKWNSFWPEIKPFLVR